MKKKLILIFFYMIFSDLKAQEILPEKIVENFFSLIQEKSPSTAIDYLFSNNPQLYQKSESLQQLKNFFLNIDQFLGKFYGYEIIHKKEYHHSLYIIIVFTKYEKQPLKFLFVFYKPVNKWITYRFEVDTQYPDNFIDSIFKK